MIRLIKQETKIDFLKIRKPAYVFSLALLAITLVSIGYHKGFNLSIEFTGGTMVQLKFDKPIEQDIGKIRSIVNGLNFGSPEIKTIGSAANHEVQITVKAQAEGVQVGESIKKAILEKYPENSFQLRTEQKIGPKIGRELTRNAVLAILLGWLAIILYIWIRFNLPFGVAGVVGILHDCFITLGFFSLTNREISLATIAALLTIMGYSINDTIVIFDRVRENLGGKLHGVNLSDIINRSVNQMLGRTIITTGTVLFVLIAFSFFGGEVIRDFALAMLVGCISGVYSTVYICGNVVVDWHRKWPLRA